MVKNNRETSYVVSMILLLGVAYGLVETGLSMAVIFLSRPASQARAAGSPSLEVRVIAVGVLVVGLLWGVVIGWWSDRPTRWGGWAGLASGGVALVLFGLFSIPGVIVAGGVLNIRAHSLLLAVPFYLIPPVLGGIPAARRRLRKARQAVLVPPQVKADVRSKKRRAALLAVWQIFLLGVAYAMGYAALILLDAELVGLFWPASGRAAGLLWLVPVLIAIPSLGLPWGFVIGQWSDRATWWGGWAGLGAGIGALVAPDLVLFLLLAYATVFGLSAGFGAAPPRDLAVWSHLHLLRELRGPEVVGAVLGGLPAAALILVPAVLGGIYAARHRPRWAFIVEGEAEDASGGQGTAADATVAEGTPSPARGAPTAEGETTSREQEDA